MTSLQCIRPVKVHLLCRLPLLSLVLPLILSCSSAGRVPPPDSFNLNHEEILLLADRTEREEYQEAFMTSGSAVEVFLDSFWSRRDPTPGTPQNEYHVRWEARDEVAHKQLLAPGSDLTDDRRLVYLLYGAPPAVRRSTDYFGIEHIAWVYRIAERPEAERAAHTVVGRYRYDLGFKLDEEVGWKANPSIDKLESPPALTARKIARLTALIDDDARSDEIRTAAAWRLRLDTGPEAMGALLERLDSEVPGVRDYIAEAMLPVEFYLEDPARLPSERQKPGGSGRPVIRHRAAPAPVIADSTGREIPALTAQDIPDLIQQSHDPGASFSPAELNSMERQPVVDRASFREGWLSPEEADSLYTGRLGTVREMLDAGNGAEVHAFLDPLLKQELIRNPEAFYLDALALLMTETPGGRLLAEDRIRQAMRLDTGNGRYWLLLAKIQYARTMSYYTDDTLDRVLDELPSMGDAHALKGQLRIETLWGLGWHSSGWWVTPLNEQRQMPEELQAEAVDHLNRALLYDPDNRLATWFLGVNSLMARDWESSIRVMTYLIEHDVHVAEAYLGRGLALQHLGLLDRAMTDYAAGVELLPEKARHLSGDPRWAMSSSRGGILSNADITPDSTMAAGSEYQGTFWRAKDILFSTDVNERLAEQYRRFAHVAWKYAVPDLGIRGWESVRGQVYLRFGEPLRTNAEGDRVRKVMQRIALSGDPNRTSESVARKSVDNPSEMWTYEDGLTFTFGGGLMSGNLTFWPSLSDYHINSLADFRDLTEETPASEVVIGAPELIPMDVRWYTFSAVDGSAEYIPIISVEGFQQLKADSLIFSLYQPLSTFILDEQWQIVERRESFIPNWAWSTGARNSWVGNRVNLARSTGTRFAAVEFMPVERGVPALASRDTLDALTTDGSLTLSSLIPAFMVVPTSDASGWAEGTHIIRGNRAIIPNASAAFETDAAVYICTEIYGLTKDTVGATHYEIAVSVQPLDDQRSFLATVTDFLGRLISRDTQEGIVTLTFLRDGISDRSFEWMPLAFLSETEPGQYLVTLSITDTNSGNTVSRSIVVTLAEQE
ncbi:GWxTD domain-containing protein [Gemmatimonadota bacterium]